MDEQVLLLHGFNKSSRDMQTLFTYLEQHGFHCRSLDLSFTYHEFGQSFFLVEEVLSEMVSHKKTPIHLVGHSTGGLLIRKVLQETQWMDSIGHCVQIATPNRGSRLAHVAGKIAGYTECYRTLRSLNATYIEQLNLPDITSYSIGAIAGTRNHLWLGKLIQGANDGRVELDSVYYPGLSDFIALPYGHKEIHHQKEVAELTARFLQTGHF
ncbi:alpha/beta hydrolase [Sporosarcina sp. P3]|uniref:lipase family alpha/beta hydrolase n=1 Tax=Sporosarcina sp. P3 TaxID=2048245 RepID=UPI000C16683C|nr:alpha/beta hydrolase [Sporosarcina sp. P3]PID20875.1 alpha/beta hydrolase [Sporosarcina sp. P3]